MNTEDVQTEGPDLCSVVDALHCFGAGGSRGTRETERERGCEESVDCWKEKLKECTSLSTVLKHILLECESFMKHMTVTSSPLKANGCIFFVCFLLSTHR